MKKLVYTALILSISITSCKQGEEKSTVTASEQKTESVRTIQLLPKTISHTIEYQATLQPLEEIHLAPAAPGRIDKINVEVGDRITKGALLVQMDRTSYIRLKYN